jgi:hypothetical protein
MPVLFQRRSELRPLRQSFPQVDAKLRARVMTEVVYRILDFVMPSKDKTLTFDKLTGKRR